MNLFALLVLGLTVAITFVGFFIAYRVGKHTRQFVWREYVLLVAVVVLSVIPAAYVYGVPLATYIIVAMIAGMGMEYTIGAVYLGTLNRRLWKYSHLSFNGHTSVLVAPFWAMAGLFFFLLGQVLVG